MFGNLQTAATENNSPNRSTTLKSQVIYAPQFYSGELFSIIHITHKNKPIYHTHWVLVQPLSSSNV